MKYEAKKKDVIYFETLNIEWGQIDPKGNRRVKKHLYVLILLKCYSEFPTHLKLIKRKKKLSDVKITK